MQIKELITDECLNMLNRMRFGRIACSQNDQPYVVPFYFAFDGKRHLYAFSTFGKKIEWMRKNPLVCVEVEEIESQENWATLVIFGRYEELPPEPDFEDQRIQAHELLSRRPMWWQPAYVSRTYRERTQEEIVYFRVRIERIHGQRAGAKNIEEILSAEQPTGLKKMAARDASNSLFGEK